MKKLTLLSAVFLLGVLLTQAGFANGTYKYVSKPHLRIQAGQTTIDAIYVPVNVPVADVRVGFYAKTIMYSSLRVTLVSPRGQQVVLKQESGNPSGVPLFGSMGSPRSMVLFQQGGNPLGAQPNDRTVNTATSLALFNGALSAGWWQIQVVDERNFGQYAPPQDGFLEEWALMFNRQIDEPIQPFNPPINITFPGGSSLRGQINGTTATQIEPNRAQIPNDNVSQTPGSVCNVPNDPGVVLGRDGDCFPVIISGHPGAMIGTDANGYPAGRFRVTIRVETSYAPGMTIDKAYTEDIAIYFGRVPDSPGFLPLPAPPSNGDPGFQAKAPSGWPTGNGTVNSLQGGASGAYGGVRLAACLSTDIAADKGGYDLVTFDDFAFEQIASGLPAGPNEGFTGTYRSEQPLSSLNGFPVDGLYYVSVYDCFHDTQNGYGNVRVTYLQIEYIIGGGEISDPDRHQGIVGPLMGIPIPGTFTGSAIGYLSDVVGVIPPYKENAKDQDPILVFWATQKMYQRDATGTERIMAVDMSNYAPPSGTHYHGPYAYPGALDSDPAVAGSLVNADDLILPKGDYNLRINLMQARYDDDLTDNEYESPKINVNDVSMSYHGEQIIMWTKYVDPWNEMIPASATVGPNQGLGNAFTLFKNPTTHVASVDYRFDKGLLPVTPRARVRATVWACAGGLTGAPTTVVARSPYVNMSDYVEGNWRTFPIYPITPNGDADINAGGSVNLPQGTYVVTIDNGDFQGQNFLVYPYTYGAIPALYDRYNDYLFGDMFGPLGPYSSLGTFMTYINTDNSTPPDLSFGDANGVFSNFVAPIRVNMTNLNDFAVNYVRFSSQSSHDEAITVGQPVTPTVNVTAASTQNGQNKDFNIYLGIYDGGNNLLYSDMVNVANTGGINGYQTLSINMDSWTPQTGGIYKVKAYFTRNPDDQNPVNDMIQFDLHVFAAPVVLYDPGMSGTALNELVDLLSSRGADPVLVNASEGDLSAYKNSTIFVLGNVNNDLLTSAVASGNDIAFVFDRNGKIGPTVQKIDALYGIERARATDYDNVELAAALKAEPNAARKNNVQPIQLPIFDTKEDVLTYIASQDLKIEAPQSFRKEGKPATSFENVLSVATGSKYGEIRYTGEYTGSLGIIYTVPSKRIPGDVRVEAPTPVAFALEQNYPNPFNPSTAISYTLPEASVVTLRILDVLGREVATLISSTQDAGTYTINWKGMDQNGAEVASGNYFYRLDAVPTSGAASFSSTKKMVLSK